MNAILRLDRVMREETLTLEDMSPMGTTGSHLRVTLFGSTVMLDPHDVERVYCALGKWLGIETVYGFTPSSASSEGERTVWLGTKNGMELHSEVLDPNETVQLVKVTRR